MSELAGATPKKKEGGGGLCPPLSLPSSIVICGSEYKVVYCDKPTDVDPLGRKPYWGMVDPWAATITVYRGERKTFDVWETILHEIIHALTSALHMEGDVTKEDNVDLLAMGMLDTFVRNGWVGVK